MFVTTIEDWWASVCYDNSRSTGEHLFVTTIEGQPDYCIFHSDADRSFDDNFKAAKRSSMILKSYLPHTRHHGYLTMRYHNVTLRPFQSFAIGADRGSTDIPVACVGCRWDKKYSFVLNQLWKLMRQVKQLKRKVIFIQKPLKRLNQTKSRTFWLRRPKLYDESIQVNHHFMVSLFSFL